MSQVKSASMNRTERKKEDTRQKIILLAMSLFHRQGFATTTMEQIAAEADIAKGTLYNYFPVKEAILDEFIRRSFIEQNTARARLMQTLPDTRTRMEQVFGDLLSGIRRQKDIFEKYIIYRMQHWISFQLEENEKSGFHLVAAEIVRLGQASSELRSDLPSEMLEDLCEYVFMLAVKKFYLFPANFDEQRTIEHCGDIFMHGAGTRPNGV